MTNTPKFDQALDEILAGLKPHQRTCRETGEAFEIGEREIELCKSLRVPPPTTVWWAASRLKTAHTSALEIFRRELADGSSVVSMFDPESPVPILPNKVWHSDAFDPFSYGFPVRLDVPFFDQWEVLSKSVPRPAIIQDAKSENSEWSVNSLEAKNCYCNFAGLRNEDLIYADGNGWSKHSIFITWCTRSESCFQCAACHECHRVAFSERCERCVNMFFSLLCKDCTDCFGCTNLRRKKFCFLNEQLTEADYRERLQAIDLTDALVIAEWKERTGLLWDEAYCPAGLIRHSERAIGDDIEDSSDVTGISIRKSERVYDSYAVLQLKDSWYTTGSGLGSERCYHSIGVLKGYENRMVKNCLSCIDVEYSEFLTSCEHCFGCIGLKHVSYCIFNRQYTPEEYWPLVDTIKTRMLHDGIYGEFFSYRLASNAYNASRAMPEHPISEQEAIRLGARWYGFTQEKQASARSIEEPPIKLSDVGDGVVGQRYRCPVTQRAFGFIKPELAFYREQGYALSRVHPIVSRMRNFAAPLPIRLWTRSCTNCAKQVETRLPPTHPSPLLCLECYETKVQQG